ncbi:MAG: hypothetical protein KGL37_05005 [Acidobacteriota bacterium]|nr:hypothetical protein [Acidobacteriota bacterium]
MSERGEHHRAGGQLPAAAGGARALYPQRLIDGKPAPYESPIIMAGDNYEPRCAEHFLLPGRPH